jgi:hypothetical protein
MTHRFKPRFKGLAWASIGVGTPVATLGVLGGMVIVPIAVGLASIAAGTAYLASPTWRLEVAVDDDGLEVRTPKRVRFKLAWRDVAKVVASPTTHTCFVDGGAPERSLLVPGVGAPAPYDIADKAALYDAILARVPADRVETVERLELYKRAAKGSPA